MSLITQSNQISMSSESNFDEIFETLEPIFPTFYAAYDLDQDLYDFIHDELDESLRPEWYDGSFAIAWGE